MTRRDHALRADGLRLHRARLATGMPPIELAFHLSVTPAQIKAWEAGDEAIPPETWEHIKVCLPWIPAGPFIADLPLRKAATLLGYTVGERADLGRKHITHPDDALDKVRALTRAASVELSDREAEALRIWTHADTLEETGERMGVTRERARQLVYKALRRIRGDEGPPTQGGWPKPAPEPPAPRIVYAFGPDRRLTPQVITSR